MVTIETTPERGEFIKQIVENALTFAVMTNRGVYASVMMTLLGTEVTDEERDAILRQVDESLAEVNWHRSTQLQMYTPIVECVKYILANPSEFSRADMLDSLSQSTDDLLAYEEDQNAAA